ncbi:MAG: hemerythrin domain-containing protein [Candidatus Saccharicenans sp.]|nr:hemerythrin domain-containing protein [Candidatus Saccharicenans sp.]
MKPTDELKKEHRAIEIMLTILTEVARRLEAGRGADLKDLNDILEFLKVFADRCHHAKEEEVLFPAMDKAGLPREQGPIAVMLAEHQAGRELIKEMNESLEGIARGEDRAGLNFAGQARAYAELLRLHIDKEHGILYPMADGRLSRKTQENLKEGFELIELEVVGPGRHQEFHRLLDRLEERYLVHAESG